MAHGWYETAAQADQYFTTRFGAEEWATLDQNSKKIPLLVTAHKRIARSKLLSLPGQPDTNQLLLLQEAQAEMAWYLYKHQQDEDARMGLRTQGVLEAGIAEEKYSKSNIETQPLPPAVLDILDQFKTKEIETLRETIIPFFSTTIYRQD